MTKNKKGFTIIEVVLVLAIAGLIFLMVFIALPALQRSQRNTQREDDLSRFLTAANDYQTNNNGKSPFAKTSNHNSGVDNKFVKRYIDSECTSGSNGRYTGCGSEFTDPDGTIYAMKWFSKVTKDNTSIGNITWDAGNVSEDGTKSNHLVRVYTNASCGDEGIANKGTGDRQYAMFYVLEGGSVSCNDNH
jgi:prepilin-type N-terminal cleavage/methylation domain-containing protein